jgi:hypothetical protein
MIVDRETERIQTPKGCHSFIKNNVIPSGFCGDKIKSRIIPSFQDLELHKAN